LLKPINLSVFRFQQFTIVQSKNPLKVGTDSMLLGSFIDPTPSETALDIGAGTGVLTLMVLQKNPNLIVDAVEIHEDAAAECAFNVEQSPWQDRVKVHALNFLEFNPNKQYDLIFSNPPFYLDGLKSGIESIDQAKHISHEMYGCFIQKTAGLLREDGRFYVIVPWTQLAYLLDLAKDNKLHLREKISIHATEEKLNTRVILMFTKRDEPIILSEFTIRLTSGGYTPEYISLTKQYHATDLAPKH
jgi:tRNA1Val (adenine37-N6)-methyltransferase